MTSDSMVWDDPCEADPAFETVADYIAAKWLATPEEQRERWADVDWFPYEYGATLLDVPCGSGSYHDYFVEDLGFDYTGCDGSQRMVEIAQAAHPEGQFVHALLPADSDSDDRLPFEDDAFDVVFCTDLLQHLPESLPAMEELRRVGKLWLVVNQRAMIEGPPTKWRENRGRHGEIVRLETLEDVRDTMLQFDPQGEEHLMWEETIPMKTEADRRFVEAYYVFLIGG